MLVGVIAAVTCFGGFGPPRTNCPQEVDAKGYALLFAECPNDGFEIFIKDSGKTWEDVTAMKTAAEEKPDNSWLVFLLGSLDMDYMVKVAMPGRKLPVADGHITTDFSGYFKADTPSAELNNFGLHDIY